MKDIENIDQVLSDGIFLEELNEDFNYHFSYLINILASNDKCNDKIKDHIHELKEDYKIFKSLVEKYPDSNLIEGYKTVIFDTPKEKLPISIYNRIYLDRKSAEEANSGYIRMHIPER